MPWGSFMSWWISVISSAFKVIGLSSVDIGLIVHLANVVNKGIGDAGSTADLRMLWSAIVCLGLL